MNEYDILFLKRNAKQKIYREYQRKKSFVKDAVTESKDIKEEGQRKTKKALTANVPFPFVFVPQMKMQAFLLEAW